MAISYLFLMAVCAVAAALITLIRVVGFRRVLKHATAIDVIFTVMLCFIFAGTITGMLIAILAGLLMTGTLTFCKWFVGGVDHVRARPRPTVFTYEGDDWTPPNGWDKL